MGNLEQAAEKKPLIVLTGPTAVGKTALSIQLARRIGGEIISADSMQVYRHMDIGTAKIRLEEMDGVPHHLIDILEPTEDFNVVRFQALARAAAEDIYSRGKIPIVAGGTGFYIQALLNDIDFTQIDENTQFREEMERLAAEQGAEVLIVKLHAVCLTRPVGDVPHELMLLVGADEKRRRERVEAALLRGPCRLKKPHFVAFNAPARDIVCYLAHERPQAVIVAHEKRQFDGLRVFL